MNPRYHRAEGVEAAPMHEETILFDPATKRFCLLNGTAAFLWDQLQEPCTADQVSRGLRQRFADVDTERVERDVQAALQQLADLALVVAEA